MKAYGKNIIFVVNYEGTPFLAFNDFESAKNWLEKERGATQIQDMELI